VPLILFAPFLLFALMVFSVRFRRPASNLGLFAFLVGLATSLLVGWAEVAKAKPYTTSFPYLTLSVAFTGATRFQNFNLDLAFRIDHVAIAALVAVYSVGFLCLLWHRAAGRDEQGPVRFQAAMLLFAFAASGVVVSPDLTELLAFWGLAGVAGYLLVAHRWGSRDVARPAQAALWLPFGGDLCLLLGLGLLYSRYGMPLNPERLAPLLHSTPGAGLKSLTVACVLILAAVLVRSGVAPFHAWCVGTRDAPPAGVAYLQAVWPLLAGLLLYRSLPLFIGAGPQALRLAAYACLVCALLGPLLGLAGNDARRVVSLAGTGVVALLLFSLWQPVTGSGGRALAGAVGLAGLVALGASRAALLLAVNSIGLRLRSYSLSDMGEGLARLPVSTLALGLAGLVVALAAVPAATQLGGGGLFDPGRSGVSAGSSLVRRQLVFAVGMLVAAAVVWRVFVAVGFGRLRRRRAFEPDRVREVPWQMAGGPLLAGLLGLAGVLLAFFTRWLDFLEAGRHTVPTTRTTVLWLAVPVVGSALAVLGYTLQRDRLLGFSARVAAELHRGRSVGLALLRRFVGQPGTGLIEEIEEQGVGGAESGLARALRRAGRLGLERLPGLPVLLALGVLGVVALVVIAPGVGR
jgi:NADH:ubiquinone oxidoreductase subunit 5 (subunit L)/multisubunit Na+/H+ antiporter MnhA subunit